MKYNSFCFFTVIILLLNDAIFAQETTVQLPTNDNTSSFNITKNNGASVLKVNGSGQISGDGSGLSNVKSVTSYAQGNQSVYFHEGMIAGLNLYEAQKMREVTISCPGPGVIFALASGYCDWESKGEDLVRIWFYPHPTVSPTSSWETPDFHNLRIVSDYQCADSSDQYTSWSITKTYSVSSAQNYTVSVCADKPFTSSKVLIGDVVLQLMYFPTGGTGEASPRIAYSGDAEELQPDGIDTNTIDGSPMGTPEENIVNPGNETSDQDTKIKKLESELELIKQQLNQLLEINKVNK